MGNDLGGDRSPNLSAIYPSMQTGSNEPTANEAGGSVPAREESQRGPEGLPLPVSQEAPAVANVLPPDDGSAAQKSDGSDCVPPPIDLQEEYRYYKKGINPKRASVRSKYLRSRHDKFGRFQKPYRMRPGYAKRKPEPNSNFVAAVLAKNKHLKRMQAELAIGFRERQDRARRAILKVEMEPIQKQIDELQPQIEGMVELLIALDTKMQKLLNQATWVKSKADTVEVTSDWTLKRRIKKQIDRCTIAAQAQAVQAEQAHLRAQHKFWKKVKGKYTSPVPLIIKKTKERHARERREREQAAQAGATQTPQSPQ